MENKPRTPIVVGEGAPRTAVSDWLDPALGLAGCEPMVDRAMGLVELLQSPTPQMLVPNQQ